MRESFTDGEKEIKISIWNNQIKQSSKYKMDKFIIQRMTCLINLTIEAVSISTGSTRD